MLSLGTTQNCFNHGKITVACSVQCSFIIYILLYYFELAFLLIFHFNSSFSHFVMCLCFVNISILFVIQLKRD